MSFPSTSSVIVAVTLAACAFALPACSSSTTGSSSGTSGTSGTSGSTTPASAADCKSRCEAKFTKCEADQATATSGCSGQVCNASPTADQLTCLEGKTCDEIANSTGFASLCPASSTTTPPTTPTAVKCGTATCASGEYCSLTYDSSAMAWTPSSCKKIPAACASSTSLCTCMTQNSGCSTSGVISTKCSQTDGALSFGCE